MFFLLPVHQALCITTGSCCVTLWMAKGWTSSLWLTAAGWRTREKLVCQSCFQTPTLQDLTASLARGYRIIATSRYWHMWLLSVVSSRFNVIRDSSTLCTFLGAGVFPQQSCASWGNALVLRVQWFPQLHPEKRWPTCTHAAQHVRVQAHSHAQPGRSRPRTLQVRV